MEYRFWGKSGLHVSALSFGSWLTFGKQIGDDSAEKLMSIAYDRGVNFFDNAEIYARGQSEIVMGNILKKMNRERSAWIVSSKVYCGNGGKKPNQTGLTGPLMEHAKSAGSPIINWRAIFRGCLCGSLVYVLSSD